ncbi:hypothetical protein C1I95_07930 [Micromonospora craterilacus]|uniref:Uncharacterized protein n=1 Tax=Micromonospora craterilacus TaxID=1655439 RepID=A0A2W2F6M7_9ACTN|nr:hypothetical protein C1I95_07930 [Micromonospora craterilacus]
MPPQGGRRDDTREATSPYTVMFSRQARRNLHKDLPLEVAKSSEDSPGPCRIAAVPFVAR